MSNYIPCIGKLVVDEAVILAALEKMDKHSPDFGRIPINDLLPRLSEGQDSIKSVHLVGEGEAFSIPGWVVTATMYRVYIHCRPAEERTYPANNVTYLFTYDDCDIYPEQYRLTQIELDKYLHSDSMTFGRGGRGCLSIVDSHISYDPIINRDFRGKGEVVDDRLSHNHLPADYSDEQAILRNFDNPMVLPRATGVKFKVTGINILKAIHNPIENHPVLAILAALSGGGEDLRSCFLINHDGDYHLYLRTEMYPLKVGFHHVRPINILKIRTYEDTVRLIVGEVEYLYFKMNQIELSKEFAFLDLLTNEDQQVFPKQEVK